MVVALVVAVLFLNLFLKLHIQPLVVVAVVDGELVVVVV
jgi:hypothetical protein